MGGLPPSQRRHARTHSTDDARPLQRGRGNPPSGSAAGATAVLHVLATPLVHRHASSSRHSIPCSLVACPAVHSLYLHPSRFYHPTLHSLGVIGKGERVETLRPRNQGVTTSPRRPIVLHGSSFNSFLWKRPPGEAPIVLHGNGQGWLTGQTRRPAG